MNGDRIAFRIEHDDLEQAASGISADHQHPVRALEHEAKRDADRGANVIVDYAVPTSTVGDLHT